MFCSLSLSLLDDSVAYMGNADGGRRTRCLGSFDTLNKVSSLNIGVRANIHLGGQTEFCPNGEHNLFVTRPRRVFFSPGYA